MTKDPVCGMHVDEKMAPSSTHMGQKMVFLLPNLQERFRGMSVEIHGQAMAPFEPRPLVAIGCRDKTGAPATKGDGWRSRPPKWCIR